MKHFTKNCTLLVFMFLAHFVQAQCPVPASAVAFTASPSGTNCAQNEITFTITNPDPNYTYSWNFDDAASSNNTANGTVVTHSFSANNAGGSHNVKVTAMPNSNTVQAATWTNVHSNITAIGNSLFKNSGTGSSYNSGAESTQSINDNMYVEFSAGITSNRLICGLGNGNIGNHGSSSIDYGIETRHDGTIRVYENGSNQGSFGNYAYGDILRVAVESGVVRYYKNGTLIYTSSAAPTLPMFVDLSIRNENDTLHNVLIGNSCVGSDSMTINTSATPEISVTGTWDRCIAVDNLGFTNTLFQINNYDPTLTYTWNFGDGSGTNTLIGNIQTHTYSTHGTYDVTITATNGSCVGTYTNQVLYLERPLANMVIVGTADICEGDTIYVANNTDTTNIDYFVLDWGDGTRDTVTTTDTLFHIYTFSDVYACTISQGGEPYTITLYAVNACFEHTNASPITVTATPRSDFSAPDIVCETVNANGGVSFSAAICPSPTDIFSDLNNYIWDFGDPASGASNTSTFSSPTHVFTGPGDYEVTVQLISNCGTFYDTMNVIILENPDANYSYLVNNPPSNTVNGDGCAPIEVQFTNSTIGDSVTYSWAVQTNVVGGASFINGTSDTSTNPEMAFSLPGDYIVTLSATNQCTTTTFVDTITVLDGPTVTINPPSPTCDIFLYTPDVVYGGGGGAIQTYNWSFPGAIPSSSNQANPTNILYLSSGTYHAYVEITNECTVVRDTVSFYVPLTPTPVTLSANGNQNTCLNSAAFNLSADSTGGTWSGPGITDQNLGTFNPLLAGVGTHTITYTYNPRVCPSTTTINITVNALPTVSASGDTSLCISDGIMTLGGENPIGGTWSGTGISDANAGTFDPNDSGAGVFPVVYTYTDGNGCTNTDTRDVRVYALPVLNLGGDKSECNGPDDIPLIAAPSGGTWSGTGVNSGNNTFNTINAGGLGTYKAYYNYTDGNGCSNMDSINIDVITGTTVDAGTDTTLCEATDPITLANGTPTGGVWEGTGVFNNSGTYSFYPSIANVGTHNIVYKLGIGSCEERDTMVIEVIARPSIDAGLDTSVCINSPAFDMYGFTPIAGGTWSGAGLTGISFDPSTGTGTYNLTYSYTDPVTQCENTDVRVIAVNALPTVIASPVATECNVNNDIQLTGFSPGGGNWTGAGITNASLGTFNPNTAGGLSYDGSDTTYNLTYTYTDLNGCINAANSVITVTFGDTVEAGPDDTLCINAGSFALSGFTPIAGGTWSGNGVAGSTFFPSAAGVGPHTLTYTYGSGSCLKTDTRTILVLDIPTVNAGNDTLICENTNPIQLEPFSPIGGTWSGTGVTGDIFNPDATGDGTFIVTYSYTDPTSGCTNTDTKTITVAPLPNVTTNGNEVYCFTPNNITLTNYNPAGGTWSGAGITNANSGIFNGVTAGGLGFNNADTTYPVIYSYTNGNGCTNTDTLDITITDGIDAFAGVNDTVCQYDPTFIINGFSPAGGTWSGSGIVNANTGQYDPSSVTPGTYNLIYTIGSGTCQDSDTMTMLIVPTPVVEAGSNIQICADNPAFTLTGFSPVGGTWSGTGITDSLTAVFDPSVSGAGTFTITYTYAEPINGCENTDTRTITVHPLPNITMPDTLMYCNSGGDITISGYTPTGGIWSGQGITDANAGIFNTVVAGGLGYNDADTTYPLLYIYTDANGCIDSSDLTLMLILGDTIDAGPNLAMCVTDDPDTLTGFVPSSGGTWSGAGIVNSSLGIFDPSIGAGIYTVTYTHGNGTCLKTDTRDILVGAVPTVIAGNDIDYCITEPQDTLTGFSPAGGVWSGTGITNATNGYFHPDTAGVGSHSITYTYTHPTTGCENTDIRILNVNPLPVVDAGDTVIYCNNPNNITLSGYSPAGGIWTGAGIIDGINGIFNTTVAGGIGANNVDTTYPVIYTVTSGDGCVDSDTLTIIVEFGDTVSAGGPYGVCIDDGLVTLSGHSPTGGTWSGTGITNAANGIFDPTTAPSNVLIDLVYTYGSGTCQKKDTTTIFVGLIPSVEAGTNDTICSADPPLTLNNYVPSTGGVWSGTGITDAINGIFDPSVAGVGTWTLTYTYTNTFTGCENSDTKLMTVRPAPIVNAGNDRTECNNSADVTLSGYSPLGGIWSGLGIIDANNGIFNTIIAGGVGPNNTPAVYTLTYTYTDGIGCTNVDSMLFTVEFGDTVDAGPNFNVCEDAGLQTLVGSPAGGTWSGTGVIDPTGIFDPSVPTPGAFYTLTYTYGVGTCQKTDNIQVFVSPEITVDAGPNITVCLSSAAFNLTGNSPSSGGTWSGAGIIDASAGTFDPSVAGLGNHVVTFDYVNSVTGCQGSDTRIVSVVDIPVTEAGNPVTYCNNPNNITLSGYSPLGGTWSGPGIVDGINGIFNTVSAGGLGYNNGDTTYQVVYTYSSGSNCSDTDTLEITVEFGEIVNAGLDDTTCIDDGQLTLVGSPVGGTWSGNGIIDPFAGIFDPTVSGAGLITLTYTHGTGSCEKSDNVNIFVGALPVINPGANDIVCIDNGILTLSGYSPQGGVWSGTGIVDGNAGTFDPTIGTGTHTLTYTYTNPITGCDSSVTKTVTVNPLPNVTAPDTVEYCNTTTDISLAGLASPASGVWSGTGVSNGNFNASLAGGIGAYTITYLYTNSNGCENTADMVVNIIYGDTVYAGVNDTLCIDDAQITLVGSPVGGTWSGTGIIDANSGIFDPATATAGLHTLTYTYGTGTCEKTDDVTILVGALPVINPGANDIVCIDNGILTLSGYSPQGGVWSGTGIVDGNAGTFDPTVGTGTYTLTYTYANPITGCDRSVTKTVTVNPLPNVTAPDTVEYCNTTTDISLAGLASPAGGVWSGTGVSNGNFNASLAGGIGVYTITYLYTNGNGCENTADMVVNIIYGDTVYAGVNDTLCIDDAQITLVGSPVGGTWSGTGIIDANSGIFDPATATAGLHTLTYTYGTGTCEKTDDVTILVGALPVINPGANDVVCIDNGILTLSGYSPQGGIWSGTGIVDGNAGTFDPTVAVGTYTLTYTYANPITGCDRSVTKTVTVNPLPVVNASDVTFCNNINDISLNGLGAPNNGTWSGVGVVDANGLFNSNIAGGLGYNGADTIYTLTYTYTNANGCTNSDDINVTVTFGDTVEAGPNLAMCKTDGLINMTGYSPLGGTWSGNGIIDANNGTFDPTQVTAGFHTLTYTFGTGSCLKTDTRTIYVDTIPTVIAGPDRTVCQQASPITISTGSPAGGFWTGTGIDSAGNFIPQNMSVGTFKLAYTYVNTTTGCRNTDTLAITVEAPPVVDAGPDDIYCNTNQNITLSGHTPASGGLWNGPGIIDGINGIFNTQTAGGLGYNNGDTIYQVVYTYTNNNGCFNRDTLDITVEFGDLVDAGLPDTICIDNGQFVLGGYMPLGGTWSGFGISNPNLGIFDPAISGTGTHTVTYTYGVGTCQKSDSKTIFVDALPIVSAGVDETICIDNGLLTLSGYTPQGGIWGGTGITDPNAGIFDPSVSNLGTFTLTYTFTNPITGCSETDIKLVKVAPIPNVTAGGTVTYCNSPNQITISDYTTFSPNGGLWSGPGIINATQGTFNTVIAGGLAQNGGDTTYFLTYTYEDNNGCEGSDILTVTVTYGDTVVAGTNQSICEDAGLITLTGFSPAGGTWSGPGIIDPAGIFDPQAPGVFLNANNVLTYTYGTGTCLKTANKTIFVGTPPSISAGVDQTVCIDNGQFTLTGYIPFGGFWTGTGVDSSGVFDPSVGVGSYTLTYTYINSVTGCEVTDTKIVAVAPLPTVTTTPTVTYCDIASNITLTGFSPAGGTWSGPGVVSGGLALFNTTQAGGLASDGGDTTYTLTYTYTDGNGCENSSTMDVTVTYGDTVVAGSNQAICYDAGLLNLTGFSPAGGTWSGPGIIDPIAGVFDPQGAGVVQNANNVITYTYGTGTCEKSVPKTIFVGIDPIVEAGPNLERCIDEGLFQLTNYSPLGGTWSGAGITDPANGFFDPAVAGDGTWTLTYSYTNSITGCEASDTRTVIIHPLPIVTAPDTLEFCNTTINITLSGFAPLGGTWIGTGIVDQNNGIFNTGIAGGIGTYDIEYRYTDVNGCTNNDSTVINVIFGDTVEAGPDLAVCITDAPIILTNFQPVGSTWSGPGITDPSGVFDPQVAQSGLHTLTITYGTGTCLKTDTREIFVGDIPNVLAGPDIDVCGQDADFMLTGSTPPGGFWTGVGVDSSGLFSPVGATPGTWTLTYTYVNPNTGCENSDTRVVFVETPPIVDAGGTVTYCNSTNNILLDQHSPTGGVWSGSGIVDGLNGIFNTTAAGGLAHNGGDTTYYAVYEFTSPTGCFGRDTLEITVTFGDTVYAGVDDTICLDGGLLTLVGSPVGGIWSGLGIVDSVSGTFDPTVAGTGLKTLSYTFGQETCEKTDLKTVFVGPLPVISPGVNELVCVDEPAFMLSNFSPQGGYWIGVGVDSAGMFDPTTAGVGTWSLTYTFTNSITGCDNSATKEITVAPLPSVVVPNSIEYCFNPNDITLSGYSPSGGSWSGSGIVSANAGIFSTVLAGGLATNGADTTYPVIYTYTDVNGCTNKDTMAINVIFGDTVNAGPDMNICITDGLITLGGYTPTSGGTWSGPGIIDANAGIFDPNVTGGGTFTVCYTFGTGTCEKEDCRTIFVGTVPSVNAGPDILVCEDQTAFTLNSFSPTGGVWSGTGITDSINAVFDPQVTGTGTFTLVYDYVNNTTGCENFDTRQVVVAPLPIVDIDDSLEFCINNNNLALTNYVNTTPSTGLTWSGSGIVDPLNGLFNATIAGGLGQYPIVINYVDANGCSNRDTLIIDVIFGDTVEAGPDDTLCINDNPILLTGFSPIGGVFSGAGVDAVSGTFDPATAGTGLHTITYTFGTGTCEKTDTRKILVGGLPSINIGPNQTVCIDGGSFTLSAYSPQGGTWSGVGITDPIAGVFNIDSAGVGTHILTYTFANSITGCENTAQRTITVAPLPIVDAGNPLLICDNPDDYTIPTANYSPNGGTWSGQGIVNSTNGVFNTVIAGGLGYNNADTIYPVVYTFTDGNSCTNFDTLEVTVQFGDSIYAGENEALCIDIGLYQLTNFLPTTNGLWSSHPVGNPLGANGIVDPVNGVFDPQAAGAGAHLVTISTGVGTCAKTDDKIIFVGTPPAVNPGNNQAVCADDTSFALTGFSPPGGIWSGVGITDSMNAIFDPQVSGEGTFVLTYTFVNSVTNCETVATKQITVNPLPFVDAGDTVTYCDNPNDIVLNGYTPAGGGFWTGLGITNPSQGIFNTGQAGGIGIYDLTYSYTDPFTGCSNRDTLVVDVIFGDTVVAGPNDTLCIQDLPINLQGSPAGGFWTGTGITNGNLGTFNPAIAEGGTHILTYTFGVGTCQKTDTKIIFVGEPDPLNAGNDKILCVDAPPITLTASLPGGVWSGNGITNTTTGVFNPGVALVGLHNIVYTYTNSVTGCVSMDTLVIEVKPLPVVNTAGAITYCEWPLNVQLPTPNLTPGVWSGAGIVDINNGLFNSIVAGGLGANGVDTIYPITYTHTDAFGCSNSDILNVTITYGDSVLAGPDIVACVDDNPITLAGTPVGGVWTGFGITDPTGTFNPAVGIGGGTFDVIYTQGAGTCEKSDTLTITIIDVTGSTAGLDEEFCYEDGLVTLTGNSPLGGVWTGPGIQDGNLGTFLTQAVSTGINSDTVQICYTYTDALSGCDYTDCKNVIVRPLPVVGFNVVDTACVNDVITFNNTSVDAISFKWYFGDGDSSNFLTPTHVYNTSGAYTVTLIAYSDYGCPDTLTQDILIYETPTAGYTMSTKDGCGPLTVSFTNTSIIQGQGLQYSWDFGNGLTSVQANPPAQTYNAGVEDTVYIVSLTVTNLCGATTFTDSITVRAEPNVIFIADDNYGCGPLVVNFSNASTGGPNSYLWNFGPFGASTDTIPPPVSFTITDTVAVTYWVTLTATNACGTDIDSLPITVIPGSLDAGIGTNVTEGCEPLMVNFTSAVQPGDNVQWIFGDGNGSILNNPTHLFDTVGTFTVYQIVTNQCGSDTATVDITVHPQPPMSISHAPFVCLDQPMQFYNNSNPISGTVWAFGDGDSSTLTNPTHVYTTPGFYTVYVTNYSITHQCPRTDSTIVEVKDIPNASFTLDEMEGCAPLTVNFTNNSTGMFSSWMFINGTGADTVVSIVQNPTHTFTEYGQHYVVLRTSDQSGCFEDTTITGIVVYPDPVAAFTPDVDQQCGLDATVTLNNNSTDADAYFWDFGNGTFSNVTSPTISYNNIGNHTIFLEVSNTFGCKDTLIDEITVYPSPNADFDLNPQTGCEPLTVQFLQLATNTNGYFWDFGDGETSSDANPIHTYSAGAYNVTFVASIDGLCFDTIVIADAVYAEGSPIADFEILQSDPDNPTGVIDFVNNSIGATQYEWEFGDGTFSNEKNPSKEYLENGQRIVRLIVWNDQGCSDTLIQVIEPLGFKGLFVPNAFSPDAGIGDVRIFKPVGVSIETYKAQVFSQWGELLWESEALDDAGRPTEGWDGTYKGTQMPQGAYVWKVEAVFKDGSIWEGQKNTLGQTRKLGSVTLLR